MLTFATVSWRPNTFYAGGLDPVVVAKALLSVIALTMAFHVRTSCVRPQPIRTRAVWFLLAYIAISTLGAWSTNSVLPSAVLGIRLLVIALAACLLARTFPREELLRSWLAALATVGLLAAVTGLPSLAGGRLYGGVPPLHPNEMAIGCGLPAVGLAWLALQGRARPVHVVLLGVLLALVWMTGSRTSLMAVIVALFVMGLQARRLSRTTAVAVVAAFCGLVYAVTATDIFAAFFLRGGEQNVTTLSSRTIAWSAAFSFSDSDWVRWMGAGLATKEIPVVGQYWQTQVLDSSWMSALVHAGRAGVVVLALWSLVVAVTALTERPAARMAWTGLLIFVLVFSFLQSGLVDSSPSFITFVLVGLYAGMPAGGTESSSGTARRLVRAHAVAR